MRQPFHLIVHPVPCQGLQRPDDARVQHPPPRVQQTPVGHLMGEGVREGVGALREQAGFVK